MKKLFFILTFILPLLGSSQELRLFNIQLFSFDSVQKGAFIPLTDMNLWNEETWPFAEVFYEKNELKKDEIQTLPQNIKSDFLNFVKIKETDSIFIYNMLLDTVFKFQVDKTELIRKQNPYFGEVVALKILDLDLESMGTFYWNSFVFIGSSNPFQTGNIHQIKWQKVHKSEFPSGIEIPINKNWEDTYSPGETYKYLTNEHEYLIQNLEVLKGMTEGRHLIIRHKETKEIVHNSAFMYTEGTDLSPLFSESENNQWTGKIFKNKPTILYGFLWLSFGCPSIDFIGNKEPSLIIYCDNRH
ncbi:hypothetical protein [Brumimicrobium mesophilum]|uniref:hypothetical protein n=1 Tax=Brumimicrobium mesophilum TaxID=392717 RepID=UPI000D141DE9|nr:hypothetical protein [Brumimicrobium mesophilum]